MYLSPLSLFTVSFTNTDAVIPDLIKATSLEILICNKVYSLFLKCYLAKMWLQKYMHCPHKLTQSVRARIRSRYVLALDIGIPKLHLNMWNQCNFRCLFFKHITVADLSHICFTDNELTLGQIMACFCRQSNNYIKLHDWPRFMTPRVVTRPQWVTLSIQGRLSLLIWPLTLMLCHCEKWVRQFQSI